MEGARPLICPLPLEKWPLAQGLCPFLVYSGGQTCILCFRPPFKMYNFRIYIRPILGIRDLGCTLPRPSFPLYVNFNLRFIPRAALYECMIRRIILGFWEIWLQRGNGFLCLFGLGFNISEAFPYPEITGQNWSSSREIPGSRDLIFF